MIAQSLAILIDSGQPVKMFNGLYQGRFQPQPVGIKILPIFLLQQLVDLHGCKLCQSREEKIGNKELRSKNPNGGKPGPPKNWLSLLSNEGLHGSVVSILAATGLNPDSRGFFLIMMLLSQPTAH